jgi:hypothetical protein
MLTSLERNSDSQIWKKRKPHKKYIGNNAKFCFYLKKQFNHSFVADFNAMFFRYVMKQYLKPLDDEN